MKEVEFKDVAEGASFCSASGEFVKMNDNCAKRTEEHWKTSAKVWRFSPISKVYVK